MSSTTLRWRIGLAVFVAVAVVRLSLAMYIATPVPFYDEWQAVIDQIARPALAHAFDPGVLLALHYEHVLAPSRLLAWCVLRANDMQFDNTLICAFNQLLRAAIRRLAVDDRAVSGLVAACVTAPALPYQQRMIG